VRQLSTAVLLYGPKAAGKSWVADELRRRRAGVQHVDADRVVLDLLDRGARPDRQLGWLDQALWYPQVVNRTPSRATSGRRVLDLMDPTPVRAPPPPRR
jgi:hypothetical protein